MDMYAIILDVEFILNLKKKKGKKKITVITFATLQQEHIDPGRMW